MEYIGKYQRTSILILVGLVTDTQPMEESIFHFGEVVETEVAVVIIATVIQSHGIERLHSFMELV